MHRFFISPDNLRKDTVYLSERHAHQMRNVLRMAPGQRIVVLDNRGWEYEVELTTLRRKKATGQVISKQAVTGEPQVQVTLYQSLTKRSKFEWVLQKGTEIGVCRFVPLVTQRSLVRETAVIKPNRMARWRRIITEAAEQSGRGLLPELRAPVELAAAFAERDAYQLALMPWGEAAQKNVRTTLAQMAQPPLAIALFVGPEGGFAEEEVEDGRRHNVIPITLGPRTLRTETAAVVATSLILHELGELQ